MYVGPPTTTLRNGRALSSTIIVSRPLGVSLDPVKKPLDRPAPLQKPQDHHHASFSFSQDFQLSRPHIKIQQSEEKTQEASEEQVEAPEFQGGTGSTTVGVKDKIKFYTLECRVGEACSAIIPAPAPFTPRPAARAFSPEQLKRYLAQFSMRSGFGYNDDFEESGKPSDDPDPNPPRSSSRRALQPYSILDDPNFWPGSQYRPRRGVFPSRGSVYKYQAYRPNLDYTWEKIRPDEQRPQVWNDYQQSTPYTDAHTPYRPHNKPKPSPFTDTRQRPSNRPSGEVKKGTWGRYGTSTVAQLDKNTGTWIPVSSTTLHLPSNGPSPTQAPTHLSGFSPPQRTQVKLTVLGMDEPHPSRPFSSSHSQGHSFQHPSGLPDGSPALIETGGPGLPLTSPRHPPLAGLTPSGVLHVSLPLTLLSSSSSSNTGAFHTRSYSFSSPSNTLNTSSNTTTTTLASTNTTTTTTPIPTTTQTSSNNTNTSTTSTTTTTTPPSTTTTTTTTTTTRPRPRPPNTSRNKTPTTTTTTTTTASPSLLDNPYAVMAAVGAGVVPVTLAALLPVLIGRRRRRRSYDTLLPYPMLQSLLPDASDVPHLNTLPGSTRDDIPVNFPALLSLLSTLPVSSDRHTTFPVLTTSTSHTNPVSATLHPMSPTTYDSLYALPATSATLPATLPLGPASNSLVTGVQATVATHYTPSNTQLTLPASPDSSATQRTLPASQRTLPKLFVSQRTLPGTKHTFSYTPASIATQHTLLTTLSGTIPATLYPGKKRWPLGGDRRRETGMRDRGPDGHS
ncbi:hypothetical protein Pmani_037487 [Petrolisthes manimaculis]|uniref:Uncharacterized protein n=1 Tax=Petrolisthes manimaculis TaxID=1843537 RepID=A0AAE1TLD5_9EUCA|nr:hypothetical protein Pmani_037487 [Petrolisthes manimaculis]